MDDYTVTRAWAAAFDAAGFNGIRYGSRFTTGPPAAWALFGTAGEQPVKILERSTGIDACQMVGIRVIGPISGTESITLA